jgi:hypothetical protein
LQKFALMVVLSLAQGVNDLDENLLHNIFRKALFLDEQIDRGIDLLLMPVEKFFKRAVIAIQVLDNELLVTDWGNLHTSLAFVGVFV